MTRVSTSSRSEVGAASALAVIRCLLVGSSRGRTGQRAPDIPAELFLHRRRRRIWGETGDESSRSHYMWASLAVDRRDRRPDRQFRIYREREELEPPICRSMADTCRAGWPIT